MSLSLCKVRAITQIIDNQTLLPVTCKLSGCTAVGPVKRNEQGKRPVFYLAVKLNNINQGILQQVDAAAKQCGLMSEGPYDCKKSTLVIKLPFGGRSFQCRIADDTGYLYTPYDIKKGRQMDLYIKFGGIWPDGSGYSWLCEEIRLGEQSAQLT